MWGLSSAQVTVYGTPTFEGCCRRLDASILFVSCPLRYHFFDVALHFIFNFIQISLPLQNETNRRNYKKKRKNTSAVRTDSVFVSFRFVVLVTSRPAAPCRAAPRCSFVPIALLFDESPLKKYPFFATYFVKF